MAAIVTSKTRKYATTKPPLGSVVNWGHPLASGLVGCWLMNEGGGKIARNIVNQEKPTTFTGGSWKPSSKGYVVKFDGSTNIQFNNYTRFLTNRNMSMISWGIFPNNPGGYEFFSGFRDVGYDVARFYFLHLAGSMNFECRLTTTGGTWDANINSVPSGIPNMLSLTYQPGKLISYLNANQRTLNTSASGYITAIGNNNHFNMGTQIDGANDSNASMIMSLLYNRALSPSEIKSLYESPYQFVASPRNRIYSIPDSVATTTTHIITSKTRRYSTIKPPVGSQLDFSHPLSKGLVGAWLLNEGGNRITDIATNNGKSPASGSNTWGVWSKGFGVSVLQTTNFGNLSRYNFSNQFSIIYAMQSTEHRLIMSKKLTSGAYTGWSIGDNFERPRLIVTDGGVDETFDTGSDSYKANDSLHHQWAVTVLRDGASLSRWFRDGKSIATKTYSRTATLENTNGLSIATNGLITYYIYLYNRALSPSEIKSLYESPYQFVAPLRSRYIEQWGAGAAPGGTLYQQTCEESMTVSDSYTRLSNSIRIFAETVTVSDIMNRVALVRRILSETGTMSDILLRPLKASRIYSEQSTVTDSILRVFKAVRILNEEMTVSDLLSIPGLPTKYTLDLSEQITVSDVYSRAAKLLRTYADAMTASADVTAEEPPAIPATQQVLSEVMAVHDVALFFLTHGKRTTTWTEVIASASLWTQVNTSTSLWTQVGE